MFDRSRPFNYLLLRWFKSDEHLLAFSHKGIQTSYLCFLPFNQSGECGQCTDQNSDTVEGCFLSTNAESQYRPYGFAILPIYLLAVALVGAALLYFHLVNLRGFWFDEIKTLDAVRLSFSDMISHRMRAGHPPFYFGFMWVWCKAFGYSETVLRLPSIFFALGSALLIYLVLAEFTDRWTGLLASILLLLAPFQFYHALQARAGTMLEFFALLATWSLYRAEKTQNSGYLIALATSTTIYLFTHYCGLLVLFGQLTYIFLRRKPLVKIAFVLIVPLLLFSPVIIYSLFGLHTTDKIRWLGPLEHIFLFRLISEQFFGRTLLTQNLALTIISFFIIVCLVFLGAYRLGIRFRLLFILWLSPLLLGLLAVTLGYPNIFARSRYWIVSLSIQVALVAVALQPRKEIFNKYLSGAAAVILLAVCSYGVYFDMTMGREPDWRKIAQFVERRMDGNEQVSAVGTFWLPVWFHYYSKPTFLTNSPEAPPVSSYEQMRQNHTASKRYPFWMTISRLNDGIWLVFAGEYNRITPTDRYALRQLYLRFPIKEEFVIEGQRIVHLAKR